MNPIALISQKLAARRYRKATGMDRPIEELARENRERARENDLACLVSPDERREVHEIADGMHWTEADWEAAIELLKLGIPVPKLTCSILATRSIHRAYGMPSVEAAYIVAMTLNMVGCK